MVQHRITKLIYPIDCILSQIFKNILNIFISNLKPQQIDNPYIQIDVNKIRLRIVFEIQIGYKLELLSKELMR